MLQQTHKLKDLSVWANHLILVIWISEV